MCHRKVFPDKISEKNKVFMSIILTGRESAVYVDSAQKKKSKFSHSCLTCSFPSVVCSYSLRLSKSTGLHQGMSTHTEEGILMHSAKC